MMAYIRMGPQSDVYVFASINGSIICCGCRLDVFFSCDDDKPEEMVNHLHRHEDAGHKVPSRVYDRLGV